MRSQIALLLALSVVIAPAEAGEWETSGSAGAELRWFTTGPAFPGQLDDGQASLVLGPEWQWDSRDRRHQLSFAPFVRLDARDEERTHFDLREGYWRYVADDWEVLAGVNKVFWGVTESRHLVDVVNQTDTVEDIDEEDKLGQPMIQVAAQRPWGRVEAFALLGFRERTFPGPDGRLRPPVAVDGTGARFESGAADRRLDLAFRYSHYVGNWDIGAHWFHGTDREPVLLQDSAGTRLTPFYRVIHQAGVDLQYTREAWLWKLEALVRKGQGRTFGAMVGGFEYTFYQVAGSAADVGLLAEYLYDDRTAAAPITAFDDDLFVGSRLALNDTQDTQVLAGAVVDRDDRSVSAFVEAERRIGSRYRIELETRWFLNVDRANALAVLARDDFVNLRFSRFF